MIVLALDTSASLCAACVFDTDTAAILGRASEDIGRGHAERLMEIIDEALTASGRRLADVGRVAVTTGPGSFTGVRVGLSTARGLALALNIPCIGVSTLEAIAHAQHRGSGDRPLLVVMDARRGEVYAQLFDGTDDAAATPQALTLDAAAKLAHDRGADLAGSGAPLVKAAGPTGYAPRLLTLAAAPDIADVAMLAAIRGDEGPPSPLYLRGADAKVQAGFALERAMRGPA